MTKLHTRYVQIDGWIFEVKAVRAIRADSYGEPYTAIANFNLQNDHAHIDGLMTRKHDDFSREDHKAFEKYFSTLGIQDVSFERYCNNKFITKTKKRDTQSQTEKSPLLTLVR